MSLDIPTLIQTLHLTSIVKIVLLVILGGYIIFLLIIYRQIRLMNQIIMQAVYGRILEFTVLLLILGTIALFIASLAIL